MTGPRFKRGDHVEKINGSRWRGTVVGEYSTAWTPEGYAVESDTETGSVQIYPAKALAMVHQSAQSTTTVRADATSSLGDYYGTIDLAKRYDEIAPSQNTAIMALAKDISLHVAALEMLCARRVK